ncbi:MAG: isoprenylcysteine carboxylmethyltransferase family protein [Alphaproteobacteria bacterium]
MTASAAGRPDAPIALSRVQHRRKRMLALLAVPLVALVAVTRSWGEADGVAHHFVEAIGWFAIVACIIGRTWCTLYIGGRKKAELVRRGPYSIVRNPLYLFTLAGAVGIGLSTGSVLLGAGLGLVVFLVFDSVIRREERWLADQLGADYRAYLAEVPRWWPRLGRWRDDRSLTISPALVAGTFKDAALFALAIPALEILESLQDWGIVPVLLLLP